MKNLLFILLLSVLKLNAQESLNYQLPPDEILELVDVTLAPSVLIDDKKENMIFLYRDAYKNIDDLSREELRLAGLRIDPITNISSRKTYYNNIKIKDINNRSNLVQIDGIPDNSKLSNFQFSPDQNKIAFTNTTLIGVELWVLDIKKRKLKKLTEHNVNANLGDVFKWFKNSQSILVKFIPENRKDIIKSKNTVPVGPIVSTNNGKKAQNRTYQDLLKNKIDEQNFENITSSDLYKVSLNGKIIKWLPTDMYNKIDFSPNGMYVLVSTLKKPFSYIVPYYKFSSQTTIFSKNGKKIEVVLDVPLIEDLPKGFMSVRQGRRSLSWRNDKPASLVFIKALDDGDPEKKVLYRDELFQLDPPFNNKPNSLVKTINRFSNVLWCNDSIAIVSDYWWNNRNTKTYIFNPKNNKSKVHKIFDRNYQDRYTDPGNFITKKNNIGSNLLVVKDGYLFLNGSGYSKKGQFPFINKLNISSK